MHVIVYECHAVVFYNIVLCVFNILVKNGINYGLKTLKLLNYFVTIITVQQTDHQCLIDYIPLMKKTYLNPYYICADIEDCSVIGLYYTYYYHVFNMM